MNKIVDFLDNYYSKAQKLSKDFDVTRSFDWTPLLILNELSVQVGHVYNIIYQNEAVNEPNRSFENLGDELSDIFLQLIALADSMNINMYHVETLEKIKENNWYAFPVLLGQLNEAVMEKYGYRFNKPRSGFKTTEDFIENRILKLFNVTYQIAIKYHLDIEDEFQKMLDDANAFLKRFLDTKAPIEYIDTYNEKHQFIGKFERKKAHELGLWHEVFGALIVNPTTQKIYFQIKNYKYNNINNQNLLEITAGGHLVSGETIEDGIREVREETGLEITFDQAIFILKRVCDKDNSMLIREFQYYYYFSIDVNLQNFQINNKEILGFVEIDLQDALNLLTKQTGFYSCLVKTKNGISKKYLKIDDFDNAYINNGLFVNLIQKIKELINQ